MMTLQKGRKEGTCPPNSPPDPRPRPSACRATGAERCRSPISRGKTWSCTSTPAPTPGCTIESKAFSSLSKAFAKAGTAVLGVSADPVKAQDAFKAKHRLAVPLASDEAHRMLEAYGVWGEKSMYGRKFMGIIRTTVLIDATGRIALIWPKVKVEGHAEEVLAAAKAL